MTKKYQFLVVDDEDIILKATSIVLQRSFECDVIECVGGVKGLATFEKNPTGYDLIISDLMMPDINGLEMCRSIREANKTVPIIVLTADHRAHSQEEAAKVAINEYVGKPFDSDVFVTTIQRLLDQTSKKDTRVAMFLRQFDAQVEMILNGKVPAGLSSLDFILKALERHGFESRRLDAMQRMVPHLKKEISFIEARDTFMYLKTLRDQRIGRIEMVRDRLAKMAEKEKSTEA